MHYAKGILTYNIKIHHKSRRMTIIDVGQIRRGHLSPSLFLQIHRQLFIDLHLLFIFKPEASFSPSKNVSRRLAVLS